MSQAELIIHVYQPSEDEATEEMTSGLGGDSPGEDVMAASICDLPSRAFEGLWFESVSLADQPNNLTLRV